ncbi:MAG TPA: membrane protein insertase YidC [Thermoanaerobaculia bacterium]|nr:membrane protein insertase YidC [Thermoanaerobaculia bacterium]
MDNRRLLIAFLLSMIVIGVWFWLFPPPKPATPPPVLPTSQTAQTSQTPAPGQPTPGPAATPAPGAAASAATPTAPAAPAEAIQAAAEERVTLSDGRTRAVFTNRGAQLVSMVVPEKESLKSGTLELVRSRAGGSYPYALVTRALKPHPLDDALFRAEKSPDGRSVLFRYSGPLGVAEKRFGFDPRGLLEVDVRLAGPADWGVFLGPGLRNLTTEEMKSRFEHRRAVYKRGEAVTVLDASGAFDPVEVPGQGLAWVGLADTYFLSAEVPQNGLGRAVLQPVLVQEAKGEGATFVPVPPKDVITKEQKDLPREFTLVLEPAGDRLSLASYWGSKEYERLKALPYGLEGSVEMGKFGFLARPLLAGLHWIYDHVVQNYGWAIILMTVLIKLVLLPVTHKSTLSMRKMQELNPKVQAIRDKYRTKLKDKQGRPNLESQRKMNEEVMAVYKENGVNPAGGCFPLLLQMPILFAFYGLLGSAVELRKAPWILWIHDLSVHDPYYVLPIIMGITQFLQVRMGPQGGDPMQRKMFQLMPLVMTFLFLGFPSGLVLYWLTNNILTILQLQVYNRQQKAAA